VYFKYDNEPMPAPSNLYDFYPAESFFDVYYMGELGQEEVVVDVGPASVLNNVLPAGAGVVTMPDIPQGHMECAPTSCANSLVWLAERDGWVNQLLGAAGRPQDGSFDRSNSTDESNQTDDEKALIGKLKDNMKPGWQAPFPGLNGNEMETGKASFIGPPNNLPIEVHGGNDDPAATGASMFDWIKQEKEKGQDVEMLVFLLDDQGSTKGGHWVTVTDIAINGNKVTVDVCDPGDDKGTSQKADISHWTANKTTGVFSGPKAKAGWAVAESPKDSSCCNKRGDVNNDGSGPDISDLVYLVTYMFQGGPVPPCLEACDLNGSGTGPDIADLVYLVTYMFQSGPAPVACP
jgi:hypothetical protein